jgi:hypothetical protein
MITQIKHFKPITNNDAYDVYGKTCTDYAFENFDSLLAAKLFRNGYDVTQPVKYLDKTIFNIQDSYGRYFLTLLFQDRTMGTCKISCG